MCPFAGVFMRKSLIISNLICARATASHASLGARYHEVAEDHDLTQREEEILYLLAQGRRAADIAEALTRMDNFLTNLRKKQAREG